MKIDITKIQEKFPENFKPSMVERYALGLSDVIRNRPGIECGEFVRLITGYKGGDLSSVEAKMALITTSVPSEGFAFIDDGGLNGHIGVVVSDIVKLKDGTYDFFGADANTHLDNNKKLDGIVHYRKFNSKTLRGFANLGIKTEYLMPESIVSGLIEPPIDDRDVWFSDIEKIHRNAVLPTRFVIEGLTYHSQGAFPICVPSAITSVAKWHYKKTGKEHDFSRAALYVEANQFESDSNDKVSGCNPRSALEVARKIGLILEEKASIPDVGIVEEGWFNGWKMVTEAQKDSERFKIGGYVIVPSKDIQKLKEAIYYTGPVNVTVNTYTGWYLGIAPSKIGTPNHFTTIIGWDSDVFETLDSMQHNEFDDGRHKLHPSNIYDAFCITGLTPIDTEEVKANTHIDYYAVLNRYGMAKDFKAEQRARALLTEAFGHESKAMYAVYAKNQQIYTNAVAYGGYNVQYFKLLQWHKGDIVNQAYAEMMGQKLPFDLNNKRSHY